MTPVLFPKETTTAYEQDHKQSQKRKMFMLHSTKYNEKLS